jgi:hypothetical protein
MLLMALSMTMSFSVANAVHERIRLQSHADAVAFSMAVLEARAMNYIAYSNRAIAAAFVSMTSVHAYAAIASSAVPLLQAAQYIMLMVMGEEAALCYPGMQLQHCPHTLPVMMRMMNYANLVSQYQNKLKQIEQPLNDAVKAFVELAGDIHKSQHSMVETTKQTLESGNTLDGMRTRNAPCAAHAFDQNPVRVKQVNVLEFACALEGSELDNSASGTKPSTNKSCAGPSDKDHRRRTMSNVVNAARPDLLKGGTMATQMPPFSTPSTGPRVFQKKFLEDLMQGQPKHKSGTGMGYQVEGWLTDSVCNRANKDSKGDSSCAKAGGTFFMFMPEDLPGMLPASDALVASNKSGGKHDPSEVHSGQHNEYKGLFADDANQPCLNKNCFINFRLDSAQNNWGQPAVYSHVTQPLQHSTNRDNTCKNTRQPWELNDSRSATIQHGSQPEGRLNFAPNRDGAAIGKAMVYFHRMDSWKFPPNLFDPYWRAKLHPMTRSEMESVLGVTGG